MKPKPDYGYYLVDIERDGTDPQPGDQYWCTLHCKWIDRIRPKLPLDENYTYRRRVPEIEGYRLLGLDEEIVPGTIFFAEGDSDRDFADPDRHIQTAHQWSSVRHVIDHFIFFNHCCYVAFYAPVEKPEKKPEANGWLPIEQFDADRHLPCWVTNGKTYNFASFRHEGRPATISGSREFDNSITFFSPITPPADLPSQDQCAFEKWWSEKDTAVKANKASAEVIWNAALEAAKEAIK